MKNQITKGHWQKGIFNALLKGEINSPLTALSGKAKSYYGHYQNSFLSMIERAEKAGYKIIRTPGVRGGECTAKYKMQILA